MTDDAQQAAWERYCKALEALGVDPYQPNLPPDDPHHEEVKLIVAEYRGIKPVKVPNGWEGTRPASLASLGDVLAWLKDEWNIVCAIEKGDEAKDAKARASRATRNAFRVLDWWDVPGRPSRPLPPATLADAKRQLTDLIDQIEKKHASGWKPSPEKAKPTKPSKGKAEVIPDDEADARAKQYLKKHPTAKTRELAKGIGIALGRVSKLPAWRAELGRRKAKKPPSSKHTIPLTKQMLASIPHEEDPAKIAMIREATWQRLVDEAKSEDDRAKLFTLDSTERGKLIDLALEQYRDKLTDGEAP